MWIFEEFYKEEEDESYVYMLLFCWCGIFYDINIVSDLFYQPMSYLNSILRPSCSFLFESGTVSEKEFLLRRLFIKEILYLSIFLEIFYSIG